MTKSKFNVNKKFDILRKLTKMVVNKVTPSLIVVGEGGLGKTYTVTSTIKELGKSDEEFIFFKGYSTARGLYNTLYDNNGKTIIFDDCDSILKDKVAINILKAALDSYDTREISWMSSMRKNDDYPSKFNFDGQIIFISNLSRSSIDNAILSRSLVVDLSMTPDEKIERMRVISRSALSMYSEEEREDAINFLNNNKNDNINMRTLIMITKMRSTFSDSWEDLASFIMESQ